MKPSRKQLPPLLVAPLPEFPSHFVAADGRTVLREVKPYTPPGRKCLVVVIQAGGRRYRRSVAKLAEAAFGKGGAA